MTTTIMELTKYTPNRPKKLFGRIQEDRMLTIKETIIILYIGIRYDFI